MAVQTGLGKHPVRFGRSLKGIEAGIRGRRMSARVMTALAELGHSAVQKFVVVAAVGRVASGAILFHGGMLPHKRPSFFGMAPVAELVDGIAFHHLGSESAVLVMTVRTFHSSFADRVMGLLVFLKLDCAVADVAKFGLRGL
jgi:hypothetical protein